MYKVRDIANAIEELAPLELAEKWDNPGLLIGDFEQSVRRIFICLDVTSENAHKAVEARADMILSHHPLIFNPIRKLIEDDYPTNVIRTLIKNDIVAYAAHTNLDNADGGMNDILADKLGLENVRKYTDAECIGGSGEPIDNIGRVGVLENPTELGDFKSFVKSALGCRSIRSVGDPAETIETVALCSGGGAFGIYAAYRAGADVYVTSDIKHHEAQLALELGINLIDAGHFETENTICEFMSNYLSERFPGLEIIVSDAEPYFS